MLLALGTFNVWGKRHPPAVWRSPKNPGPVIARLGSVAGPSIALPSRGTSGTGDAGPGCPATSRCGHPQARLQPLKTPRKAFAKPHIGLRQEQPYPPGHICASPLPLLPRPGASLPPGDHRDPADGAPRALRTPTLGTSKPAAWVWLWRCCLCSPSSPPPPAAAGFPLNHVKQIQRKTCLTASKFKPPPARVPEQGPFNAAKMQTPPGLHYVLQARYYIRLWNH